ncbi:hypothetical protein QBC32DRAFT_353234 [Pseudoneurospora amorphoporcata]|uniref:Alpha-type protein kinase domain-containing protein n=1 Tax=Pseudoneurospora amorphoporcata TaxID=241081 RepID=A0AAN6NMK3_9PEZI|nr:hypothetical protein QBC32DRAFT_353234 [Pseudoneurospora amorphoporcata]
MNLAPPNVGRPPSGTVYRNNQKEGMPDAAALLRAKLQAKKNGQPRSSPQPLGSMSADPPSPTGSTFSSSSTVISHEYGHTASSPPFMPFSAHHGPLDSMPVHAHAGSPMPGAPAPGPDTLSREQMLKQENERLLLELERLKLEADKKKPTSRGVSVDEERRRRTEELRQQEREAAATAPRRSTNGLFKAVCSTDLLFLIDTTGSMGPYIEAAKNQMKSIVDGIGKAFLNRASIRVAVVSYKDHSDAGHLQFLDFTESTDQVRSFINNLTADGGGDMPEDVLGGIRRALDASWKHQTRCIIHIADAPAHGRSMHDLSDAMDRYANPGSEPHRLTYPPLINQMLGLKVNYILLRITEHTDKMAFVFLEEYARAYGDCRLAETNKYFSKVKGLYNNSATGGLLFREAEIGISYHALQNLVVRAVTASASRTATRTCGTCKGTKVPRPGNGDGGTALPFIGEGDEEPTDAGVSMPLEEVPAQWSNLDWFEESLTVEGFSLDVMAQGSNALNAMMDRDSNITVSTLELTLRKRKTPFSQGALRVASYARTEASTNRYVVKTFKDSHHSRLAYLAEDMRCQALCKAFALEFNALLDDCHEHSIDFVVTACFKGGGSSACSGEGCMSIERYLDGKFVKYNNNAGYVNEDLGTNPSHLAAQAFSHFTYERSRGRFLVCDLQGVGEMMTDPAIHTLDPERFKLSGTNLGSEGFLLFFAFHECNLVCHKLGLKSSGEGLAAEMDGVGSPVFREDWPAMPDTVCCSNKLCGRILRRAKKNQSDHCPGYHWCDECLPQLETFKVRRMCTGPGKYHEFEVSRFFFESQGRATPTKCVIHREGDVVEPGTHTCDDDTGPGSGTKGGPSGGISLADSVVANPDFWKRFKPATVALESD